MKVHNQVEYVVYSRYAMFSDPINRMGGEKISLMIPTYQALKGITESIYFKPSIIWYIDEVRIMNPFRTESKSIRPISYNQPSNTLSVYTYLTDVKYQVRAHFTFNEFRRAELGDDFNENKHYSIAKRMIRKGGRRDIFLGTRECQGYVEPCVFGEGSGAYNESGEIQFGLMYHGFDYPDETGRDMLTVRFWQPKMVNGIIEFVQPENIPDEMKQDIRPMKAKKFGKQLNNFSGLEEAALTAEFDEEGEAEYGMDAEAL